MTEGTWLDCIANFAEEHPVWTWVLARVLVSICGCIIAVAAFLGAFLFFAPLALIEERGAIAFKAWLWLPAIVSIIWIIGEFISVVWENFIEMY